LPRAALDFRPIHKEILENESTLAAVEWTTAAAAALTSIPGIGALNATALVAAVGDARTFARSRDLAAWLGLVPRQATTGGKPRLLGITKRGSKYLRKMLTQGARSALPTLSRSKTRLGQWLRGLLARAHSNTVLLHSPPKWRVWSGCCFAVARSSMTERSPNQAIGRLRLLAGL
jgi:transposase